MVVDERATETAEDPGEGEGEGEQVDVGEGARGVDAVEQRPGERADERAEQAAEGSESAEGAEGFGEVVSEGAGAVGEVLGEVPANVADDDHPGVELPRVAAAHLQTPRSPLHDPGASRERGQKQQLTRVQGDA